MLRTFAIALAAATVARVAAQPNWPPSPGPSEKPRVVNVTLLQPGSWSMVETLYGWVTDAVENDRTTIALVCSTSSKWIIPYLDPCFQIPSATVVVAPRASSTAEMTKTQYDYECVLFPWFSVLHRLLF